ncbi:MAG: plasmid stability protein [Gammaproteobacteria bacterium]|nr:plasmid stability protein [Gammaproteobacteria bacterium]MDE0272820.1 plasmid stability protein [Gammaproteobacteria bacterium]
MPSITIKDIPSTLHERLKDAAARHRRSLQNEVVACLERYVDQLPRPKAELLAEAAALRDRLPNLDHDLVDQFKRAGRS